MTIEKIASYKFSAYDFVFVIKIYHKLLSIIKMLPLKTVKYVYIPINFFIYIRGD